MEYCDKTLCVTYEELTGGDDPVINSETLRSNITRGNIRKIRRGGGENTPALIVWSSLPEKYRTRYMERYGNPEERMAEQRMRDKVKTDGEARKYYEEYRYDMNGKENSLPEKMIEEYTLNASVLNALAADLGNKALLTRMLNNNKRDLWPLIADECEQLREIYGHTLPANLSRLKEKIRMYKKHGYMSLISGKLGNSSTVKITGNAGEWIIAKKRSKTPVYTDTQIFDEYNKVAAERGWKTLKSRRGLALWLSRPDVKPLWWGAVHGETAANQKFKRMHRTEMPSRRDSLWYGDGTKLNLYYRDEDGKIRTTMVYEVIDAYSEVMLGYWISDSEDYEAQYHAYRMAIQTSGHKPYEIVHDNQGGHKKLARKGKDAEGEPDFFGKICHIHRATAPYNPQSKTIESLFGRFQRQVLHKDWRFTGQNITAKRDDSRPDVEFIEKNKDALYTLDELKERYAEARREWNSMPHPATGVPRMEMYEKSVNDETDTVTVYDMIDIFWMWLGRPATFTGYGIEVTIGGRKRAYEVFAAPGTPDHEWRSRNTGQKFYIKYDPYDTYSIRLYKEDGAGNLRFERTAEPYRMVPRAMQDQKEGDAAFIRQEQEADRRDRIERQVAAKKIEYAHGTAPELYGLRTPGLKGVTAETQREIDRRTKKYVCNPEEVSLGRRMKNISNITDFDMEPITIDTKKTAEKL